MRCILLLSLVTATFTPKLSAIEAGQTLKDVTLQGETGGLVKDGTAWNSTMLKNNLNMVVYVDPDEKDANPALEKRLTDERFDQDRFRSVAIINMAATWKPDFIIASILESKQKEFPRTVYVRDNNKTLVKEWNLSDDAYHVLLFDKEGKLLFTKAGTFTPQEIETFIGLVKENLKS